MSPCSATDAVLPITLPTPLAVGPVWAYLIREDPITLIDCGLNLPDCLGALQEALAGHGLSLADVRRVVLTHGHVDHVGLAGWFQAQGAEVWLHPLDRAKVCREEWWEVARPRLMTEAGMPAPVQALTQQYYEMVAGLVMPLDTPLKELADGALIPFDGFALEVLWTPGHSLGHVALWWEEERVLFGGDLLLDGISPNPLAEPLPGGGRAPVLQQFLDSLDRVAALSARRVYPGHGPVITDPNRIVAGYRQHHADRLAQVLAALPPEGVRAYDLAMRFYPRVRDYNVFLAVSEVWAHLELLAARGQVRVERDPDGACRYLPV